tara:strand:+ start:9804 stop:12176 length:2373 start_codon:yes stop_codon:yes gene_type:complete
MKQGDIVIYNNKECVINGILYMYDKEPQYTLRDLESGLMINGFVSMDEMEKVEKFAEGGYAIPYSYKPKYADGKTKKDIEDLGLNAFGEFDSDDIPASSMQIDANVSYDEAKERVEEELKQRFSGVLEVDDFWIGDADTEDEKRVRVRTDIPSEETELKEIERSGKWDDSYSRLCDELATYEKGGEIDKNLTYKGDVVGFKDEGTGRAFLLGEIDIPKNSTPKSIIELAKSKFKRTWYVEVSKDGEYLYEIADDSSYKGEYPMVTSYAKGGDVTYTDTKNTTYYTGFKIWESYKNINNQQSVGSFSHNYNKRNVGDYYLFLLDDYDRKFYSHIPLKPNEMLFRSETERGRISKSLPLLKINLQNGRVYFMSDDNDMYSDYDDKNPKFEKASADVNYLSLDDRIREYIQGLITYDELSESVDNTYAKGGALSKEFRFNTNFIVYVPSTSDVGNKISKKELDKRVNEVEKFVADEFGGFSKTEVDGGYKATSGKIIEEDIVKVSVFANNDNWNNNENRVVSKVKEWANKWGQEAIGFEYEGDLYYIDDEGKFAKGGSLEDKENIKEINTEIKKLEQLKDDNNLEFADGGSVAEVKKMVYSQSGEFNLEEYQDLSNEDMMGESPMGLEEVKAKVFAYNEEAYDYEDEINKIEDVDDLSEFLYDSGLAQRDNTYNQSWWGGVRLYAILNNNGDNFDLDYPTILFMSRHRGGDVRGNYEKYEAFDIEEYGYEQIPFFSATRLTYEVKDGNKKAIFDTEDMEGFELYVVESNFDDYDEGDSTNMDEVEDKLGVELY